MATLYSTHHQTRSSRVFPTARALARRITIHLSAAVVAFAALQIFLITQFPATELPTWLPIIAFIMVIGLAIPMARRVERRWSSLINSALPSPGLSRRFRRETLRIWFFALIIPLLWVGTAALASGNA